MGLTIAIGVFFFAGMLAVLYFGYQQVEKDRADKAASGGTAHGSGPSRTADEVVFDIEHRVEGDLREVGDILRQSGPPSRLYRA